MVTHSTIRQGESGCIFIPQEMPTSEYKFECPQYVFKDKREILVSSQEQQALSQTDKINSSIFMKPF